MKEYLFKYRFGGKEWSASVFADSPEEAKSKIRAQAAAIYEGELVVRVPVLCRFSWFKRFFTKG